jgi:uncharacterized protein (TIGR02118 family)
MVTMIVCIKRKSGTTREEFSRYWRENHGPLVASCPDFTRHLTSYSQYHLADSPNAAAEFGVAGTYDGVARLKFRSAADMEQAFAEPDYLARVRPDEPRFIDIDGCMSFVTEEHRVI